MPTFTGSAAFTERTPPNARMITVRLRTSDVKLTLLYKKMEPQISQMDADCLSEVAFTGISHMC